MSDPNACMICCDTYTKSVRKRVACPSCQTACCAACFSQYVLGLAAEPFCMNNACKRAFDREFLGLHLPKTWLLTKYKTHRERVLLEREMALLPATQETLANYRYAQQLGCDIDAATAERKELTRQLADVTRHISRMRHELDVLTTSTYTRRLGGAADVAARERRQFIRACPADGCRGFLSSAWKCGTCEAWVCKDCGEPKLGGQNDEQHVCDANVAASFAMLQRDSRPCPQCAAMIFKIDGCFGKDVLVRMWDGCVKMSQDIAVGDLLVGDDGRSRTVLDTFSGEDELFRVDQARGMSYVVNSKHTLLFTEYEGTVDAYMALPHKERLRAWKVDGEQSAVSVTPIGRGRYHGWMVDGNKRFLLADATVVRNCDQARRRGRTPTAAAAAAVSVCRCFARSVTWPSAGAPAWWSPTASSTSESRPVSTRWPHSRSRQTARAKPPLRPPAAPTTTRGCGRRVARCRVPGATCPAAAPPTSTTWSAR